MGFVWESRPILHTKWEDIVEDAIGNVPGQAEIREMDFDPAHPDATLEWYWRRPMTIKEHEAWLAERIARELAIEAEEAEDRKAGF